MWKFYFENKKVKACYTCKWLSTELSDSFCCLVLLLSVVSSFGSCKAQSFALVAYKILALSSQCIPAEKNFYYFMQTDGTDFTDLP